MRLWWLRPFLAILLLSAAAAARAAPALIPTDANLVTALDVSGSVDGHAERLELLGMAAALEHPVVLQAIAAGLHRRIGFTVFTWSSAGGAFVELVPWTLIASREDAARAARALRAAHNLAPQFYAEPWRSPAPRPWVPGLATDISATIEQAIARQQAAPSSPRRVINICANGRDNVGIGPDLARDRAAAAGIGINAVVLAWQDDGLARYFWDHVRTGPDAFVIEAQELPDLTHAMLRKFVTELAWLWPAP